MFEDFTRLVKEAGTSAEDIYSPEFAKDLALGKMTMGENTGIEVENVGESMYDIENTLKGLKDAEMAEKSYDLLSRLGRYRGVS